LFGEILQARVRVRVRVRDSRVIGFLKEGSN
jgi:hypothetical protein